jgi:hypothetical protein
MVGSSPRLLRVTPAASVGVVVAVLLCFSWASASMIENDIHRSANLYQLRLVAGVSIGLVLLLRVAASPALRSLAAEFIRGFLVALTTLVTGTWLFVHLL